MDMSMDGSPIIDKTPIDGLYLNAGWCYGGFKATPASGWCFAHTIARDAPHALERGLSGSTVRDRTPDRREGRGRAAQPALKARRDAHRVLLLRRARQRGVRLPRRRHRGAPRWRSEPALDDAVRQRWHDYVYLRDNPAGPHRELWQHVSGCRPGWS
jgi:hypothetical protein